MPAKEAGILISSLPQNLLLIIIYDADDGDDALPDDGHDEHNDDNAF